MSTPRVQSETDVLQSVIVHVPDDGIEVVTPDNALEYLYDDIVYLPRMRQEHARFTRVLERFTGPGGVLDTATLFSEVLRDSGEDLRNGILDAIDQYEVFSDELYERMKRMSADDLAYTLFTGIWKDTGEVVLPPLPNYVFTRDIAVVIHDHVVICQPSKRARTRESIITRAIIHNHPLFAEARADGRIIDMTLEDKDATLEGGDVMLVHPDHLLVGCSERSTPQAFDLLKDRLHERGVVENVVRVVIPKARSSMHIDTLFTFVDRDTVVIYEDTLESEMIKVTRFHADGTRTEYPNLRSYFESIDPTMTFILCGGGQHPFDQREQWTDGCNLVAVRPGVAIAYGRNKKTSEALQAAGFQIIHSRDFVDADIDPASLRKTIIELTSSELSRARGGPHCMTFPIARQTT